MLNLTQAMIAFHASSPRKIEGAELDGWCGLEGTGYIAEIDDTTTVVLDVTDDEICVEVHTEQGDDVNIQAWMLKVTDVDMGGR